MSRVPGCGGFGSWSVGCGVLGLDGRGKNGFDPFLEVLAGLECVRGSGLRVSALGFRASGLRV